jgi:SRSO17 transposase
LLLDGDRKSIEPMAARMEGADEQALRQFVSQSPWDVELVQGQLAALLVKKFPQPQAWIIDETSFPKAGSESVGVARQYCGALGKIANCQVAVSLHYACEKVSCPVSWRLYLPEEWTEDPARRSKVKIPDSVRYQSKNDLALDLINQAQSWALPKAPVVADSAYGNDFFFREALRQHELDYAVDVEPTTKVWRSDPALVPVVQKNSTGRPRRYPSRETLPQSEDLATVAQQLPARAWKTITWREGTKGPMCSRFALLKVWASHRASSQAHPERVAEWLLIEWPREAKAPVKYQMLFFHDGHEPQLKEAVTLARTRWRVEQDYRELKEELGLDHFEGRHWLGWHHHVTLVSMAFAFLRCEQLRLKKSRHPLFTHDPPPASGSANSSERPLSLVPVAL